jgi:hypothetical protein
MSRKSKIKRDSAKRKVKVRKAKPKTESKGIRYEPFTVAEMDNPLNGLLPAERSQLLKKLQATSQSDLVDGLAALVNLMKATNPLSLITILGGYALIAAVDDEGLGEDKSIFGVSQAHVELLQSIMLTLPMSELGQDVPTTETIFTAIEQLEKVATGFSYSRLESEMDGTDDSKIAVSQLQALLRGSTQTIRNWGYHHQLVGISRTLYEPFDDTVQTRFGFSIANLIDVFEAHLHAVHERIEIYFGKFWLVKAEKNKIAAVHKYHEIVGLQPIDAQEFIQSLNIKELHIDEVKAMLLAHYNLEMLGVFDVDISAISESSKIPIEVVSLVLKYFSLGFGSLIDEKIEYFFLKNPVWIKPVVACGGGRYTCPAPYLFFSFITQAVESLIEEVDKDGLHLRRSEFLEDYIVQIVKRRFPEAWTVPSVKWSVGDRKYETDLVTAIDSHLLVIEAKSHRFSESAWRGSVDRMRRHVKEILIEPNLQSERFVAKLDFLIANPTVKDELRDQLPVPLEKIRRVIRLSVYLESLGVFQSNLALIEQAGWLPDGFNACPSISLADLETLFDLLENPIQILHYLQRRTELPSEINIHGDELDLMGIYLNTLFDFGDVSSIDGRPVHASGYSRRLDNFYATFDPRDVKKNDKPEPRITKFFKAIFDSLAQRSVYRWSEIGVVLNRFSPSDQVKIADAVRHLKQVVSKRWRKEGHNNMLIYVPHALSSYALVYIMFTDGNAARRDEFIQFAVAQAGRSEHVKKCLIIAKNIDRDDRPYHFIGLAEY